jgi:flagellar basal body rod protein FlgB
MPISTTTVEQVSAALSTASMKHQVIASNIANREALGYQRLAVQFAQVLQGDRAAPTVVAEPSSASAAASVESDMVALSANAMNYQVLAKLLGRYLAIEQAVANGGRG